MDGTIICGLGGSEGNYIVEYLCYYASKDDFLAKSNKTNNNYGGQYSQPASLGGYADFETSHIVTCNDG